MTVDHKEHDFQAKAAIKANIDKYACHLALLEADNYLPAFVYSIGLFERFHHPEIICFGLDVNVMGRIVNQACDLVKAGEKLETYKDYHGFLEGYPIQFVPVLKDFYPNDFGYGYWYYGMTTDFPAIQMVWTDKSSRFPWKEDFNPNWRFKQPVLDRNPDFKFYEERNLGVYTTSQALKGTPILFVNHNSDGDWQFHTSSEPKIEDARLVCLEELTKLDPSINEIYHLQYGWRAWRESPEHDWEYEADPFNE